jgi:hypothetical protein
MTSPAKVNSSAPTTLIIALVVAQEAASWSSMIDGKTSKVDSKGAGDMVDVGSEDHEWNWSSRYPNDLKHGGTWQSG